MYIVFKTFIDNDGFIKMPFSSIGIVKTKKDFKQMAKNAGLKYNKKQKVYYNKEEIYRLKYTKELKEL